MNIKPVFLSVSALGKAGFLFRDFDIISKTRHGGDMFILDLRVILFVALLVVCCVALLAVWFDRRFFRKHSGPNVFRIDDAVSENRLRPFLNDLAHELRTPLAVLLTHLEVQRSPTVSPETKQESIRLMQAEARRMSQMVSNILELGELETHGLTDKRLLDLRALAMQVVSELQLSAQEREITLTFHATQDAFWVNGDSYHLKQVLLNLTDNALKYSRARDRVEISLTRDVAREKILSAISDTGPGIAAEHLPHLTRRFYRATGDAIGGSGLGLSLVAAILKLHDSTLEIESKTSSEDSGTTMRFALDVAHEIGEAQ